ncbi:MAG: DUF1385 domain-containing protein [Lachnospirales bacterium]
MIYIRVTKIGGQAVIEGVMMRGKDMYALAVRNIHGEIIVEEEPLDKKFSTGLWKLPLVRGFMAFVNSFILGVKLLDRSMVLSGLDEIEEEPSKIEKFLIDKLGDKLNSFLTGISFVFAMVISLVLFVFAPIMLTKLFAPIIGTTSFAISLSEGVLRMIIFILYLYVISKNNDIQRTFMYHGAEHKTIACFEAEEDLTVENVKKHTRFHNRCGTSFLFLVMFISIIFFMFIKTDDVTMRIISRIVFIPLLAGISYEVLQYTGSHDNLFVKISSYPGVLLQKLTTSEPDNEQIEVAIASMKKVLEYQEC